jgi:hypothetical protein
MEEITLSDLEPININLGGVSGSSGSESNSFGGGIELLMNDKNKSTNSSNVNLADLDKLEDELNDLSSINLNSSNFTPKPVEKFNNFSNEPPITLKLDSDPLYADKMNDSKIGSSTVESMGNQSTWDGFAKMSELPLPSEKQQPMNERDKRRKKRTMLKNLQQWSEKGIIKDIAHLTMDSPYDEIEDEYEGAIEDKRKRDSVKIQQNWMITMVNTIEYGNSMFDPFGISLDGWGESVSEDIDSYNEIFEELHEKYKGGKMSPELSLLLRLGFSASVVHFSNKALSSAAPGFNDVIKQSPELMRMFTNATVDTMKQQSPGMAFAEELLNTKPDMSNGPPPGPVKTRSMEPPQRPGSMNYTPNVGSRPDLNASRGMMFSESGVELNNNAPANEPLPPPQPTSRPEMKGPRNTDIDNILSGLKKNDNVENIAIHKDEDSLVSVNSLSEMDKNVMPKKTKKRNISDKKVVSLDI